MNLISAVNANTEEFRNKISNINLYMKNKRLPEILNRKVRNYYNHLWSRQVTQLLAEELTISEGGLDDEGILAELPSRLRTGNRWFNWTKLRSEVSLHINGDIVTKVPFFKGCNPGFINSLVGLLKPEIYMPGDFIVTTGDVGTEMYFISQARIQTNSTDSTKGPSWSACKR